MTRKRLIAIAAGLVLLVTLSLGTFSNVAEAASLFGTTVPKAPADSDVASVELGVQFSSDVDGTIDGIRFYKSEENVGPHTGTLWTGGGKQLASAAFPINPGSGWQQAQFDRPVTIEAGSAYVASYTAPAGRYAGDQHGFDEPYQRGHLTVPAGGGVYRYGRGGFPTQSWQNANYYVDVLFSAAPTGGETPSATSTTSAEPSTQPTPSSAPPTGPPTDAPTATPRPTAPATQPGETLAQLPRIPWQGASYWKQFRKADAAGWDDPSFFPIAVWWSVASTPEEVAYDKSLGLNTYVLTNPDADYRLIEDGGMYWVGGPLPHIAENSPNWVGTFLDDEVDGRFEPTEGFKVLQDLADANKPADTGRFRYTNYTSNIESYDQSESVSNQYVNGYTEAVSLDQYFYGVPQCDWDANGLRWRTPPGGTAITPANCRTSSSYGKMVDLLRQSDATDGRLQSIWQFVEVVGDYKRLDGDKVQGQVMNSIIHGAGGIVWFPQSFEGGCETGNAFRTYQVEKSACLKAQVDGAKKINLFIKSLAPVINTQSYQWSFGADIDSMLKVQGGSAYIFAMTKDGGTGSRTFTLPGGVAGTKVEVVGENRTLEVVDGKFVDSFAKESSYHVYRISVG